MSVTRTKLLYHGAAAKLTLPQDYEVPNTGESQDTDSSFDSSQDLITKELSNRFRRKQRPATFSSSPITQLPEWNGEAQQPARTDTTPKRRLRHDNSQIQFVPIESSPPPSNADSQLLTERQKEVRERQRGSATMFLENLRSSSPALPSPIKDTGVLTPVQLPALRDAEHNSDGLLTPTLAANLQENDDAFPGSSPTPSAKDRSVPPQRTSSLPVETLDTSQRNISPPPESRSHSPRRPGVKKKSTLRRSESSNSNSELRVENSNPRRRSARHAVATSSQLNTEETHAEEVSPKQSKRSDSNEESLPDAPVDEIPDTYRDEFEQQIASQLEQDMELAVDSQELEHSESNNVSDLPAGPVTRKRKRDMATDTEHSPAPDRGKRRSLRSSQSTLVNNDVDSAIKESNTSAETAPRRAGAAKDVVTPQPSPAKSVRTPEAVVDNTTNPSSRRRSSRTSANTASEIPSCPPQSQPPSMKRRRSQRLSGPLSSPVSHSSSIPTTPRKEHKHPVSSPVNTDISTPPTRSLRSRTRLSQVTATGDADDSAAKTTVPEMSLPSEVPTKDVESSTGDERPPQKAIQNKEGDVDVDMQDPDDSSPQPPVVAEQARDDYVSHEVQPESAVVDEGEGQGSGIINSLRQVLKDIKSASFGRSVLREIDDLMFDIRVEAVKRSQA